MGRSQVERNRIKGRPGRGGRGRGSGGGGGRGRGSGGGGKKRSGPDPRTLGDNAFRYERTNHTSSKDDGGNNSDMLLLDDYNTGLLLGSDYYGASHYDMQQEEEEEYTTILPNSSENSPNDSWMAVDISALTTCLKQLPLHERLDVPYHVGMHIESRYGADTAAAGKKTLAELREESKCIVVSNDETVDDKNIISSDTKDDKADDSGDNDGDNDEDDDDLDAWLDDMIS